jgi:NADPH:quinone reductase-like Zn-dependent oxidoreductase
MTGVVLRAFAADASGVVVEHLPRMAPGAGEVAIRMIAAPINPADINIIEGNYGALPRLPAVIGNEGIGRVVACGDGVDGLAPGRLVLPMTVGTWCEEMVVPASGVIALPEALDPHQGAMIAVNPLTAWAMLHDVLPMKPGDWVVFNAANSGVGRALVALCRARGLRTLAVVRRAEAVASIDADVVVTEETDLREIVPRETGARPPRLALNGVGGASALNLANALGDGGTMVTYGAMARQPLKVPNGMLIFRGLTFCGFWLRSWLPRQPRDRIERAVSEIADLMLAGRLVFPVQQAIGLVDVHHALAEAVHPSRCGKILLALAG